MACGCLAANVGRASIDIHVADVNGVSGLTITAHDADQPFTRTIGWAGAWNAEITGGATSPPYDVGDKFLAFCTDIGNSMGNGTYQYDPKMFTSADLSSPEGVAPDPNWHDALSGQRAAWIYNTYIGTVNSANAEQVSAMAIAIWEALYEGSGTFDVTSGGGPGDYFKVSGSGTVYDDVTSLANSWLDDSTAYYTANGGFGYDLTWFQEQDTPDVQSLIGPVNPVPEPSTYLAGALLAVPFFASTLRLRRRKCS